MPNPTPAKPFKSYDELISLLLSRGMEIPDKDRAKRKLSQLGYYRLSGYWYNSRKIAKDANGNIIPSPLNTYNQRRPAKNSTSNPNIIPLRSDDFVEGTCFDDIISLYLFDKKLRLIMMDALERIEIYIRSIIAHEMGNLDPIAYEDKQYISKCFWDGKHETKGFLWDKWKSEHEVHLSRSHEDCIKWHRIMNKQIPFWVAIETWDFGLLSKYFSYLKYNFQIKITSRIDANLKPNILENWLKQLNVLRNRCAHHIRIWNQPTGNNTLATSGIPSIQKLQLSETARKRQCGLIAVICFLLHRINPTSQWFDRLCLLIKAHILLYPSHACAMGFSDATLSELAKIEQEL